MKKLLITMVLFLATISLGKVSAQETSDLTNYEKYILAKEKEGDEYVVTETPADDLYYYKTDTIYKTDTVYVTSDIDINVTDIDPYYYSSRINRFYHYSPYYYPYYYDPFYYDPFYISFGWGYPYYGYGWGYGYGYGYGGYGYGGYYPYYGNHESRYGSLGNSHYGSKNGIGYGYNNSRYVYNNSIRRDKAAWLIV